jgi:signal transduction histidine kinase
LLLRATYGEMVDVEHDANYRQRVEDGLLGQAFRTGEIVRVDDVFTDPRYLSILPGARGELCVPLRVDGEVIGVLDIQLRQANAFHDADETLLGEVGQQLAPLLRNAALYESSRRREAELEVVAEIASAISSQLQVEALLDEIHRQIQRVMTADAVFIALERCVVEATIERRAIDASTAPSGPTQLVLTRIYDGEQRVPAQEGRSVRAPAGWTEEAMRAGEPLLSLRTPEELASLAAPACAAVLGAADDGPLDAPLDEPELSRRSASLLFAPLVVGGEVLGLLSVQSTEFDAYDTWHAQLLRTIASQAAVALHNARLFVTAGEVEALRSLNAMKDEFIDTVSHELRTPIASIVGFAELLAGEKEPDGKRLPPLSPTHQARAARHIYVAAEHMRRLVDDLLEASRLNGGRLQLELASVDVARAAAEAAGVMQQTLSSGQRIVLEGAALEGSGPRRRVTADPRRLRQVLLNLLRNASSYSRAGTSIRLGAGVWSDAAVHHTMNSAGPPPGESGVHFWVADQGAGLTPEQIERVFERFWRGPLAVTAHRAGAGLGLSICRGLVEAMGGRIWAESPGPGCGATFHFVLPAAYEEAP